MLPDPYSFRISSAPAGYVPGMAQPSVTLEMEFAWPADFATQAAEKVLKDIFLIGPQEVPALGLRGKVRLDTALAELLRCSCGLARHLMQEGGIPAYATELVARSASRTEAPERCHVAMQVVAFDHIPRDRIALAYLNALNLMWPFTRPEADRPDPKPAADALHDSYIEPVRASMGRGISTSHLMKEAFSRGIPIAHLSSGVFLLGTGARSRLVIKSATDADSAIGAMIAQRKDHTEALLRDIGAPVPTSASPQDADAAVQAARALGFPVVVKPADLDRGEGVFLDLQDEEEVRSAYERARALSPRILVQQRIPGHCHRLVTFQGKFVFGYTRHPAGVDGDGERSVRALVAAFNEAQDRRARHLQGKPIPFDDEAMDCLAGQGLGPDDIPEAGRAVFLRTANLMDFAGYNETITEKVHPDNIELVERLSRHFRFESVGIDLVSTDPARPWHTTGGAITELNFKPQIGPNTARANLAAMFPGDLATIPIECFVGSDAAMRAGRRRLAALCARQPGAALTSHEITLDADGTERRLFGLRGLRARAAALLQDPRVTTLVLVVQTDELLRTGPPFRGNVTVTRIDTGVRSHTSPRQRLPQATVARLVQALKGN